MPLYEYQCQACGQKVTLLMGMVAQPDEEICPKCGSKELHRLVSRFRRGRSEDTRIDEIADGLETMGEPESAGQMREVVKELGKAMDEDLSEEMEEMFEDDMENPESDQ